MADPQASEVILGRIESRTERPNGIDGCWLWMGSLNPNGYGQINSRVYLDPKRPLLLHRVAYEFLVGPIPIGAFLDHTCHNADLRCPGGRSCQHRRCWNPSHLVPSTNEENVQRAELGERFRLRDERTHCNHGHLWDDANTYWYPRGTRVCRECVRIAGRKWDHAQRA